MLVRLAGAGDAAAVVEAERRVLRQAGVERTEVRRAEQGLLLFEVAGDDEQVRFEDVELVEYRQVGAGDRADGQFGFGRQEGIHRPPYVAATSAAGRRLAAQARDDAHRDDAHQETHAAILHDLLRGVDVPQRAAGNGDPCLLGKPGRQAAPWQQEVGSAVVVASDAGRLRRRTGRAGHLWLASRYSQQRRQRPSAAVEETASA
ncbi:MAG: hypothetical protein AW12_02629 [Candidatus Accumulibacter sp. BA-94]|nr:MAG: hypothetical protein AW12_02629 [Candidatus Accumulibacter sp. BA-94]